MKQDEPALQQPRPTADPREYLAAERTYLAWIRTGLALMGFGFVVARFGLFLRELAASGGRVQTPRGISTEFGTGLVFLGVVLTVSAVFRYLHVLKRLDRGDGIHGPSRLAIALGTTLAIAGCAITAYLLFAF